MSNDNQLQYTYFRIAYAILFVVDCNDIFHSLFK